jgi:hypothetical protein
MPPAADYAGLKNVRCDAELVFIYLLGEIHARLIRRFVRMLLTA